MNKGHISWRVLVIMAVAVVILGAAYGFWNASRSSSGQTGDAMQPVADNSEPQEVSPSEIASASQLPAVVQSTSRSAAKTTLAGAHSEPTPYTRELVASLASLDASRGPITREQAEEWKQRLGALVQQGAAGVGAIREFLEQNQELNFAAISGGELLGQSSLRGALIDALQQIGGPEARGLMLQTLQTTTLPSEIALLARCLEQQAPGQYRGEILNAANEVLSLAAQGELPSWDVGPLFQVLQNHGDVTTAAALEQLQSKWNYYAAMTLAGLPEGEGIPSLIRQVEEAAAGKGTKRDLAFQVLAQVAMQYPDAAASLLEQARLNQIPDSAWRKIIAGLAGDQYGIGSPPNLNPITKSLPGLKGYHVAVGNQNFYSLPLSATLPPDEINQRLVLLDQFRPFISSSAAAEAWQKGRDSLSGKSPGNPSH